MGSYHQLTIKERELIFLYHELNFTIRRIAKLIKRAPSTISRELKRNTPVSLRYLPSVAQKQYRMNKSRCGRSRILSNPNIKDLVGHLFLDLQWSPEEISNRLIHEDYSIRLSYSTIYRAIYQGVFNDKSLSHGNRGAIRKLRHRGKSRHTKKYGERRGQIIIPHTIHERPLTAELRSEIGHWEADTVIGKAGGQCLVTMVDRKTRYLLAGKSAYKRAVSVNKTIINLMDKLPKNLFKSITPDRGSEFARHYKITHDRQVPFYFPDAHAPWQRGSNENINGLLREYLPKGQDLSKISTREIDTFIQKINTRPRKCLGWKTPYEIFHQTTLHLI
ncbi:IS30 family transposase (plasmid) [Levilactobacillus brevis]|uniref:IS30 family transposase n=1 Tax=Levilactobacillus brevis TaxID=1580 RepID=UPI000A204551|nr:IS30 family transposase [Levilactobacillus brevis]ARN93852.1 IS30 family transposase [Levilactobacillus brevis]ARN93893.1 IS30 family transposase [Levilactobacillus brevis]ARN96388.1 IS30 family transposase [Levilactobacillus brevis]ARN96430.1 IS30 family transposase [Levilactobacillus brevis]